MKSLGFVFGKSTNSLSRNERKINLSIYRGANLLSAKSLFPLIKESNESGKTGCKQRQTILEEKGIQFSDARSKKAEKQTNNKM